MTGFVTQCVQWYLDVTNTTESALKHVPTPGLDDTAFRPDDFTSPGTLAPSAASVLMKILYLARCCRFDILHPVCTLAREITKWNRACDKRVHRLICYMHLTRLHRLEPFVGDKPEERAIIMYTDASFADCTQTSKSTTGCDIAMAGPNTFAPINALCKNQTVVSHSSTES